MILIVDSNQVFIPYPLGLGEQVKAYISVHHKFPNITGGMYIIGKDEESINERIHQFYDIFGGFAVVDLDFDEILNGWNKFTSEQSARYYLAFKSIFLGSYRRKFLEIIDDPPINCLLIFTSSVSGPLNESDIMDYFKKSILPEIKRLVLTKQRP